jgi:RNA polymerase sigma-70 factor (ECF subfamily)
VVKETLRAARRSRTLDLEQAEPLAPDDPRQSGDEGATTEAVAGLPDTYREVIVLRYYGGQSCAEISRSLDVPLGTVTKRLSRAYAMLRDRLDGRLAGAENEVQR